MRKTVFAGALALATFALLSQFSLTARAADLAAQAERGERLAAVDIGRVKSMLKLTPEQESYWPPVEAALRNLARQQARAEPAGFVRRIGRRVVSIVLNSAAIERLAVAARPLIGRLNEEQMRAASGLAQEMGLGPVVMAAMK
jgi:hypothetical protein